MKDINDTWDEDTKRELISVLTNTGALVHGKFNLASGKESTYYLDIKKACCNPNTLSIISRNICRIIPTLVQDIDVVAGIELGGVLIVIAVSLDSRIPMVIVRKKIKSYGIENFFIGEVEDKRVLILEDVTTTGGSVIEAIEKIRGVGGIVDTVITVADRDEGARENLKGIDVELIALVEHSDLKEKNYHNKDN